MKRENIPLEFVMQWCDVLADPSLQDLPYKIELNQYGKIEMSPASNKHAYLQFFFGQLLSKHNPSGYVMTECSIQTEIGVRVPDVVWCSESFHQQHGFETPYSKAPEICIEIISHANSKFEMQEKMQHYFAKGALEVWLVYEEGDVQYFNAQGPIEKNSFGIEVPENFFD